MNSLKGRLFLILVAATSLIWLAATCWIYIGATREVESVLDARLQEAARMVLSLASGSGVGATQKDGDHGQAPEVLNYERQLSCQIWSLDGRLVARSSGAPNESLSDRRAGFSERLINGETWRVYTAEDAAKGVRVAVGDRLGLREHLVGEIIKGLLTPLLLTIPLLGLLIWASLNGGLRPLQALARELGRRSADDMSPVETGKIPTEIRPVVTALNNLFLKVRDAMRHEREITAFAAHELRTPLAGLRTQAQIAMVAGDGAVREAALRQIVFAVDRTTRMVRQLLAMAKLDSNQAAKQSSINVGEVIEEVIDALPASDRNAQVRIDPALKSTMVTANKELLLIAIRNLHENAVRHMPQPGSIRWSMERSADALTIFIEDEGPGIPDDEIALVTNRFFRGRNKSALGSGLGLSIVDLALRASGARLVLHNRSDARGLRAQIVWEIAQEEAAPTSLEGSYRLVFKRSGPGLSPA
jgi:two-component system, OmpR family, sensor histidine kinase QseC